MIVYIAGPMAGMEDKNREAFRAAEEYLRLKGHTVLNPAVLPDGLPASAYMPMCLSMVQAADAVYLLKGWGRSHGAGIEYTYALYQGKKILKQAE